MDIDFITWVTNEARSRGWSDSELARRVGKSQTTVSRVLNRERKPTWDFCAGVAAAFGLSADKVFRKAGLLSPLPPEVTEDQEAQRLFRLLTPEYRAFILNILRCLVNPP